MEKVKDSELPLSAPVLVRRRKLARFLHRKAKRTGDAVVERLAQKAWTEGGGEVRSRADARRSAEEWLENPKREVMGERKTVMEELKPWEPVGYGPRWRDVTIPELAWCAAGVFKAWSDEELARAWSGEDSKALPDAEFHRRREAGQLVSPIGLVEKRLRKQCGGRPPNPDSVTVPLLVKRMARAVGMREWRSLYNDSGPGRPKKGSP